MSDHQLVKVKAGHQVNHKGQVLKAGTVFKAPPDLLTELHKAKAVDLVDEDEGHPVVELTGTDDSTLTVHGAAPVVPHASGSAAHPVKEHDDE